MIQKQKNIRSALFYLYDQLTGGNINRHLREFTELSKLKGDEVRKRQGKLYKSLINDVAVNVPAYAGYDAYTSIEDTPVLDKEYLKGNYKSFFSNKISRDDLVEAKTSGSYGTPFSFYMTSDRKARQQAEIIYFGKLSGYYIGQKHAYVRSTNKSGLKLWMQNELLISPEIINEEWLEETTERLISYGTETIIGYPTVIGNIASYCLAKGYDYSDFNVKGIITTSEPLTEMNRNTISSCFGVKVLSRYSSEELGVVAQEREVPGLHLVNHFTHLIEVLELDSNKRSKPGDLGRVVVTDLYNRAFPLIRYDTGDLAEYVPAEENKYNISALNNLQGRTIEVIYTTKGEKITPMAINGVFRDSEDSANIIQYQFIQENEREYRLLLQLLVEKLNTKPILENLKKMLGEDASIAIEYVSHIPPLKSGKRPYIVNRYEK